MWFCRVRVGLRLVLPVLALAGGSIADDNMPPPPIRDFDIATVEKVGRAMYAQDQEAWKATDVLKAHHTEAELREEKLHGWIVVSKGVMDVVRFVRVGPSGPEVAYDVSFSADAPLAITTPSDRTLAPEERAQYDARMLALANVKRRCTQIYNTVALADPAGAGWLVWAISATTDSDLVIMDGHYRFSISADGKTVKEADSLSNGCTQYSRRESKGAISFGYEQIVSLVPVETLVFTNLAYRTPLVVGTTDGRAWKIDQGSLREIYNDSPDPDGYSVRWLQGVAERCVVILRVLGEKPEKYRVGPPTKVIDATEHDSKFLPELPNGTSAADIGCVRNDIVPMPNDYKVLLAGLPLSITDKGTGHPERMCDLEVAAGRLQFRCVNGPGLTSDLQARVQARLNVLQTAYQSKASPSNPSKDSK